MELFEDGALCEDEDAFTGAALDELGEEDADFDGFSGTDSIGDQDGWPDVFECFEGWFLLDGLDIGSGLVPEGDACGVGLCGADEGFEEESAVGVIWACVWLEACVFGPDELMSSSSFQKTQGLRLVMPEMPMQWMAKPLPAGSVRRTSHCSPRHSMRAPGGGAERRAMWILYLCHCRV